MEKGKKTRHAGIYRLPDGRWRLRIAVTHPTTRKQVERAAVLAAALSLDDALAEQLRQREALRAELRQENQPPPRSQTTVADYALQWFEQRATRLKRSTCDRYEDAIGQHILPFLGECAIVTLTRADVERWVAWVESRTVPSRRPTDGPPKPYSQETLQGWWRILREILCDAAADLAFPDPTARVRGPRSKRKKTREQRTLTPDQVVSLLDAVQRDHQRWYAEVYVAVYTGLRVGEIHALRWEHLNPESQVMSIQEAVWYQHRDTTKGDAPREVAMPPAMWAVLQEHKLRLELDGHPGLSGGLVFPSDVGKPRFGSSLAKVLEAAGQAAKLPMRVTPQVLRRSFNTNMVRLGVDRLALRSQMGHTTEAMTERYAHFDPGVKVAAVTKLIEAGQGSKGEAE